MTDNMKLLVLFILISTVSADVEDYKAVVKDVKRINRRLRTIEDNIAEERMQRREDVQTVLDKLSELQAGISVIVRNNNQNDNENNLDAKQVTQLVKQMAKAITQEKKVNMRFRREVQDQLAEQRNVCTSDFKSKMDIIEYRCVNDISTGLTKYTDMSRNFVTKTDLSFAKELITKDILDRFTEFQMAISDRLKGQHSEVNHEQTNQGGSTCTTQIMREYTSCIELYHAGFTNDGIYAIYTKGRHVDVYCDQTTDGGGWIVFQRRKDGSVDFYRDWSEYKHGFGDLDGEFWLGNDALADLTEDCCHELRVDLGDVDGNIRYAKYSQFRVLNESSLYELSVNRYSGNAGNSFGHHNKMKFSTKDADHDTLDDYECAVACIGAWWYDQCFLANLNSVFHASGYTGVRKGRISWTSWKNNLGNGTYHSLTFSEMKIRARNDHS